MVRSDRGRGRLRKGPSSPAVQVPVAPVHSGVTIQAKDLSPKNSSVTQPVGSDCTPEVKANNSI